MMPKHREPICLRMRLILTGYFTLMGATSLLVMLLAMSFNVGIILAILVGEVRACVCGNVLVCLAWCSCK